MITTSRYASLTTRQFARKMADAGNTYVARGKKTVEQLAALARRMGQDSLSVVEESRGSASRIAVIAIDELGRWRWAEERLLNSTEKTI